MKETCSAWHLSYLGFVESDRQITETFCERCIALQKVQRTDLDIGEENMHGY